MFLKKFPIQKKLLLSITALFALVIILTLATISFILYRERHKDLERELGNITETVVELVMSQVRLVVEFRLEREAYSALSVLEDIYRRGRQAGLSEREIKEQATEYLSRKEIGESGYLYVIDHKGEIKIHPYPELVGESILEYDFAHAQIQSREGFLEYLWKNPGEDEYKEKALYMTYFEPFDWIISASAYEEEFLSLFSVDTIRESLEDIPVGNRGYIFIMDGGGNLLLHPRYEGKNINDLEAVNSFFLSKMPMERNGTIFYKWKDDITGRYINKFLLYRDIPKLDWIIGSSVPSGEYTDFLTRFYIYTGILFFLSLFLYYILSTRISLMFVRPLNRIMDFMGMTSYSELTDRLDASGKDEYAQLSRRINEFLDTIEEEKNNRLIAEEENRILAQFTNGNPYPVMRVDGNGSILYVNKASIELMKSWDIAYNTKLPDNLVEMIREFGGDFSDFEYRRNDRTYNIMLSYFENQMSYYLLISDITVRKEEEYLLLMSESVFSHTMEGIVITDPDGKIVRVNPAFSHICGYEEWEVLGENPSILRSDHHGEDFFREMWTSLNKTGTWTGEIWNRRKNGEPYPEWLTINRVSDDAGRLIHYVGIFKDISDIKESEEKLRYQVSHDALTGLPNRILFEDRLNRAIARAERNRYNLAVLFLDMDNFKNINDSLGHQAGDDFLKIIGERLQLSCRGEDTVARLGGDEFVILIPELTEQHNIIEITGRIQKTVGKSLLFSTHELHPSVSIGVTVFPEDGNTPALLMKNADLAMYKAKDSGKGTYSLFNREMNRQVKKRMELESQLKKSLQKREMHLMYQPKVSVRTGRITGLEALIRWNNEKLGPISPVDFIPLAEESGFIHHLGDWVLKKALVALSKLHKAGAADWEMAVNLSPRQFRDHNLTGRIESIIGRSGIDPGRINLEITEHAAMEESDQSLEIVSRLKQLGVRISIDDFGTGYSSYSYLKLFEVDCLKIDKSFVDEVPRDEKTSSIMRNIIDLGHTLNMEVVAEGVEDEDQKAFLEQNGCDVIQGYYFYKPMSLEELLKLIPE